MPTFPVVFRTFAEELPPEGCAILVAWSRCPFDASEAPYVDTEAYRLFRTTDGGWGLQLFENGDIAEWTEDELPSHWAFWPSFPQEVLHASV